MNSVSLMKWERGLFSLIHCLRIQRTTRFTSGESSESAPRKEATSSDCIRPDMPTSLIQSFRLHSPGSMIIPSLFLNGRDPSNLYSKYQLGFTFRSRSADLACELTLNKRRGSEPLDPIKLVATLRFELRTSCL